MADLSLLDEIDSLKTQDDPQSIIDAARRHDDLMKQPAGVLFEVVSAHLALAARQPDAEAAVTLKTALRFLFEMPARLKQHPVHCLLASSVFAALGRGAQAVMLLEHLRREAFEGDAAVLMADVEAAIRRSAGLPHYQPTFAETAGLVWLRFLDRESALFDALKAEDWRWSANVLLIEIFREVLGEEILVTIAPGETRPSLTVSVHCQQLYLPLVLELVRRAPAEVAQRWEIRAGEAPDGTDEPVFSMPFGGGLELSQMRFQVRTVNGIRQLVIVSKAVSEMDSPLGTPILHAMLMAFARVTGEPAFMTALPLATVESKPDPALPQMSASDLVAWVRDTVPDWRTRTFEALLATPTEIHFGVRGGALPVRADIRRLVTRFPYYQELYDAPSPSLLLVEERFGVTAGTVWIDVAQGADPDALRAALAAHLDAHPDEACRFGHAEAARRVYVDVHVWDADAFLTRLADWLKAEPGVAGGGFRLFWESFEPVTLAGPDAIDLPAVRAARLTPFLFDAARVRHVGLPDTGDLSPVEAALRWYGEGRWADVVAILQEEDPATLSDEAGLALLIAQHMTDTVEPGPGYRHHLMSFVTALERCGDAQRHTCDWQAVMGMVRMKMGDEGHALLYLEEALTIGAEAEHPPYSLEEIRKMRDRARNILRNPVFTHPFTQKIDILWSIFAKTADFVSEALTDEDPAAREKVIRDMDELLGAVIIGLDHQLTVEGGRPTLTLYGHGSPLRNLELRMMTDRLPDAVTQAWHIRHDPQTDPADDMTTPSGRYYREMPTRAYALHLRDDITAGYTLVPDLLDDYREARVEAINALHFDGLVVAMMAVPAGAGSETDRMQALDKLATELIMAMDDGVAMPVGKAVGTTNDYLDWLVIDTQAMMRALKACLDAGRLTEVRYQTMRHDALPVLLVSDAKPDPDMPPPGTLLN